MFSIFVYVFREILSLASLQNCPSQLVFNNRSRYCVYPESCSRDGEVNTLPVTLEALSTSVECEGKKEGYYAKECSSEFVYCNDEGVATYMVMSRLAVLEYCSTLPGGEYGSQCSPTFTLCSNGISYSMKCPENLVFDPKNSRCTHVHESSLGFFGTKMFYECINKSDGLHSLGCVSVFLQCLKGVAYNLYCPTGLVFVGEIGACDIPSTCSQNSKHKEANAPTSYAAVFSNNTDECDVDGYFSRKCSSEYFNCVGGKKFVGKCLNGMVFNLEKAYCDYPESCLRGELDSNPAAQSVPTTIIDRGKITCSGFTSSSVLD
ncbi:unnamed protein product [Angiostrongylus costaricensis]|uniref:Chitin-binding type-2 domain-containing protein n=1 Tax=Angiostrongylus costaricensis TaxID=334426 RepID=A0A0R3PZL9_ANGCS|nr:unnamed protein product [Angiostrongylus costaricensis]